MIVRSFFPLRPQRLNDGERRGRRIQQNVIPVPDNLRENVADNPLPQHIALLAVLERHLRPHVLLQNSPAIALGYQIILLKFIQIPADGLLGHGKFPAQLTDHHALFPVQLFQYQFSALNRQHICLLPPVPVSPDLSSMFSSLLYCSPAYLGRFSSDFSNTIAMLRRRDANIVEASAEHDVCPRRLSGALCIAM